MKSAKEQLLDVMTVLNEQAQLNPVGAAFQVTTDLFADCPNYKPLLEKLEQEFDCIEINQRPDHRGMGDADHHMYESEHPEEYVRYMSYYITLKPSFQAFYELETSEKDPKPNDKNADFDEPTFTIMWVVTKAFMDNDEKPIEIPLSVFADSDLTFKQINQILDSSASNGTIEIISRPKNAKDKTPFKLGLSDKQKKLNRQVRDELEHLRDLQMLMIYFGRICQIYDTISGGNVGFEDGQVNRVYLLLSIRLDKILAKDEFAELREQKPEIFDTLMGIFEELDISYEFMRPEIWGFYGKLERQWLEKADGLGAFELKEDEQKLLDDTEKAIDQHAERKARINANFEKRLDAMAAKMKANDTPKPDDKPKDDDKGSPLEYDDEHGKATYNGKTEKMFDAMTIMGMLTHRVTWADGARINAADILLHIEAKRIDPDKDKTTKTLTNAKDRVNVRFQEVFGIKDVIRYERQQFWLNEKYCSLKSPYRMASSGN